MGMRKKRQNGNWSSVPQFGGWNSKNPGSATNYSMVFSQARANRKQQKHEVKQATSLGTEKELMAAAVHHHDPAMWRRKIWTYINCFRP